MPLTPSCIACGRDGNDATSRRAKSPPARTCAILQPCLLIIKKIQMPTRPIGPINPRPDDRIFIVLLSAVSNSVLRAELSVKRTHGETRTPKFLGLNQTALPNLPTRACHWCLDSILGSPVCQDLGFDLSYTAEVVPIGLEPILSRV